MKIGKQVRIRKMDYNSWPEDKPCLAPGSIGRVVEIWVHPWRSDDKWYYVKFDKDNTWPMYKEEIVEV